MSNTPSLLPCPFCGGKAELVLESHDFNGCEVRCTACAAITGHYTDATGGLAIAAWNRRTPQPVAREPLTPERVEEICADLRNTVGCSNTTLARAIERAHGITQQGGQ